MNHLLNYSDGLLISKNLELFEKKDILNSSIFQKLKHWIKGTFSAKNTAIAIDNYIDKFLKGGQLKSQQDADKLLLNLTTLHRKFCTKGVNSLSLSIKKVKKVKVELEKQKPPSSTITTPIPTIPPKIKKELAAAEPKKGATSTGQVKSESTRGQSSHVAKATQAEKISKPVSDLAKQLKIVQDQINHLDLKAPNFKKDAGAIRRSLQLIAKANPQAKEDYLPLIAIMKKLEQKGGSLLNQVFLMSVYWKNLIPLIVMRQKV
jgi:hypothetical protein